MFVRKVSFTEPQLREAIASSASYAQALRLIGLRPAGGNHATIKRYAKRWQIPIDHFGPRGRYPRGGLVAKPLEEVLVVDSTYQRGSLKERLYKTGLKSPECEICGQGELWQGRHMAMILDHINGVATDNRLENLRIVCANCNATLDTHCGRNKPRGRPPRACRHCGGMFRSSHAQQAFCSRACSTAHNAPLRRRAERPPLHELLDEVSKSGYLEVGRRHGVSDNAIRKWIRAYGAVPPPGPGHQLHPPPRPARALSDSEARAALRSLADGLPVRVVAQRFGVKAHTIRDLRSGRSYRELPRPQVFGNVD